MLRELIHLARHAPATLAMKRRLSQVDLYDAVMEQSDAAGLHDRRAWLARGLHGDVLEVGCGTGLMFALYADDARVRAIDLDEDFLARAETRARPNVTIERADACALPFPDESFDAVVVSLVLCSIPEPARALAEIKRVLRRGGELRAIEHVISERPIAGALMHVVDPLWLRLNEQGCHMDRDTLATIRAVFDDVEVHERFQLFSAGLPAFPMIALRARKT